MPLAVDFQDGDSSAWSNVITFVPKLAAALVTILVGDLLRAFCQHHGLNYTRPTCSAPTPTRSATSTPSAPGYVRR